MLDQKFAEILKMVESGVIWTAEQMPIIAKELFAWKTCSYIVGIVLSTVLLFISYRIYRSAKKRVDDNSCSDWDDEVASVMGTVLFAISGFVWFSIDLYLLLQITLAPRIWLIEYISTYIK